jgi:cold shock CspA family protein
MTLRIYGHIEYWNIKRGFGFISDSDANVSRFFHLSNVADGQPQVGAACIYDEGETKKGKVALNVEILPPNHIVVSGGAL